MLLWIEQTFEEFDYVILSFWHMAAEYAGFILTPILRFVSLLGDRGIALIVFGGILLCFRKTRRTGVCVLLALGIGALITNVILKTWVGRVRPFQSPISEYFEWWILAGALPQDDFSFPSGHVTAATAVVTAFCLCEGKRVFWYIGSAFVILMGISRNYFMVHYPSDVLAAVIVGGLAGGFSYRMVGYVSKKREKRKNATAG